MSAPPPACAFKITPSTAGESEGEQTQEYRHNRERGRETERDKGRRKNRREKGGEKVRVDSVTPGTREQHQGFTSNQDAVAAAQPHVNTAASAAEHT